MVLKSTDMATNGFNPATQRANSNTTPVISVKNLHMSYGSLQAVDGVDLEINHGEIFAFLGPNGAGKTTTVEILEGFRKRSSGEVSVLGVDPEKADGAWRAKLGVVLQSCQPEKELKVRECLDFYRGFYPSPSNVKEILELVGLSHKAETKSGRLSGGELRRLDVALALIGDPELIFLDEPTTGFDPAARHAAWEMISGLRRLGKTIFLTTHFMDEAQLLADRIAIIKNGKIIAQGTPKTLGGRDEESDITFHINGGKIPANFPKELTPKVQMGLDDAVILQTSNQLQDLKSLVNWAIDNSVSINDLEVTKPSLESVYLKLVGQKK